jgi:hypothetical protein
MRVFVGAIFGAVSHQNRPIDLLPSDNSVNSAARFSPAAPLQDPQKHPKLVDAVHDRQLSAASVPAR